MRATSAALSPPDSRKKRESAPPATHHYHHQRPYCRQIPIAVAPNSILPIARRPYQTNIAADKTTIGR